MFPKGTDNNCTHFQGCGGTRHKGLGGSSTLLVSQGSCVSDVAMTVPHCVLPLLYFLSRGGQNLSTLWVKSHSEERRERKAMMSPWARSEESVRRSGRCCWPETRASDLEPLPHCRDNTSPSQNTRPMFFPKQQNFTKGHQRSQRRARWLRMKGQ